MPWYLKLVLKFCPSLFFKHYAAEQNVKYKDLERANDLFLDKKVHFQSLSGKGRGFIIQLNNSLTLWFYQDGNHFVYDGFEMGQYDDGDVTCLDRK